MSQGLDRDLENKKLSQMSFVTTVGDFLTMFALIEILYNLTGRVELAALAVTVKSGAYLVSSVVFPTLTNFFTHRKLILATQWLSFVIMASLCLVVPTLFDSPQWDSWDSAGLLGILALQAFLKRIFENSRESYSRDLRTQTTHRSFQAELLHAFYKAQFIGPILSVALIYYLPIQIPLAIDALTFLVAALIGSTLHRDEISVVKRHILAPLSYLHKHSGLLYIFFLRSTAYWIPVGIFNYLLFGVVKEHYGLQLIQSAWVYAAIGLGSMMASHMLRDSLTRKRRWLGKLPNGPLAAGALAVLALTRVAFVNLPSFEIAMIVLVISGACNGLNATATQAIRSHLTTPKNFPEVVALEQIVAHIVNFAVQMLCLWAIQNDSLGFTEGIYISSVMLIVLALMHLKKSLWIYEG